MEHVKRNQKSNSHNTQPVRIINAIHGRPEPVEESDELLRTCIRQAQMKRRIGSIPHEDPLVVSLTVAQCLVHRILIDPGNSANIMPRDTFDRLKIKRDRLKSTGNPLLGFDEKRVEPIGTVEVAVHAAERVLMETFVVVEIYPFYNLLMGRGWIHRVQGVPSTLHQVMRYLGPDGTKVIDIHADQVAAKECYSVTLKHAGKGKAPIRSIDQFRPERTTRVGGRLAEEEKQELINFLSQNADVFAWSHLDMPRIDPSVSCHSLNVNPNAKPVKQKQRRFTPERNRIISEEVDKLLDAGFVREVYYPDWLSNVVVVQKKNRKWL
ncbi:uncharacterized protein LOC132272883 [Cornus florida]|uniref:uncharacterized protein LOC132272883 n=1 Tax=Cornus florida TaxID=4283 RepID=UPI00289FA53C|nr:uncharacterized protein LOC132272883 [Cornus florida]